MNQSLTPEEKSFNDYLHDNHRTLIENAYKEFCEYGLRYDDGIYGYSWRGYKCLHKDNFTLARHFENDYADFFIRLSQQKLV